MQEEFWAERVENAPEPHILKTTTANGRNHLLTTNGAGTPREVRQSLQGAPLDDDDLRTSSRTTNVARNILQDIPKNTN